MKVQTYPAAEQANAAAAEQLARWLIAPGTRTIMVAGGNSPLDLYQRIASRRLGLAHLNVFTLDEYVGVPPEEPRNCANLLRRCVAEAWQIPAAQFHSVDSTTANARASIQAHEQQIAQAGGLDVAILGLGQNGHLGFNEPGSRPDSQGRLVTLEPSSTEANRLWFKGDYAPAVGSTVGLKTILAARRILVLAYGIHKIAAVKAMVEGEPTEQCPASFLQSHPEAWLFLDAAAGSGLRRGTVG